MTHAEREAATATALVAAAKAGDQGAFAALVTRYRKRIFALALHITGSASEADDIAQDVFLKAYRALPEFEGRSQFFTWVYRMTVNRSLNVRRDRARRGEDGLEDPRLELAVAVDARSDPGRAAELRQSYARLLRALGALPAARGDDAPQAAAPARAVGRAVARARRARPVRAGHAQGPGVEHLPRD